MHTKTLGLLAGLTLAPAEIWRAPAIDAVSGPQATASTVPATERASVKSSRVMGVGPPSPASASTHTLLIAISDHLQLLEEGHDALRAVALVHHDLS